MPPPSVPSCTAALSRTSDCSFPARRGRSSSPRSCGRLWAEKQVGTSRATRPAQFRQNFWPIRSGSSATPVSRAHMPQPMSTPTAFGRTEPRVGRTQPMVTPYPTWQSGMTATWGATSGWRAALRSWSMAPGSISSGGNQLLTGTRNPASRISIIVRPPPRPPAHPGRRGSHPFVPVSTLAHRRGTAPRRPGPRPRGTPARPRRRAAARGPAARYGQYPHSRSQAREESVPPRGLYSRLTQPA